MPLYTPQNLGKSLQVLDPLTGDKIPGVAWADTDWGMLKLYRMQQLYDGTWRVVVERGRKVADYSQRNFDLVDRITKQLVHGIRIVSPGDEAIDICQPILT